MNKKLISITLSIMLVSLSLFSGCNTSNKTTSKGFSQEDVIYFIMTDRFYDGDTSNDKDVNKDDLKAYHGGDLKGITDKLDYIKSLGATSIWITPVAQNEDGGYHGYWINDFYKVDEHLGTMEDLKNLVKEAHKKGIKVMIDYVANHTGYKTPWLSDGKHENWFHPKKEIIDFNNKNELENGWLAGLPDLNTENPEVKKYIIDNAVWWIDQTNIDGMRLDTVRHVPKDFWTDFSKTIKQKYPDFYLLGEVWDGNPSYLEEYHKTGIDGLLNYPINFGIKDAISPTGSMFSLSNAIDRDSEFSQPYLNGIFIDNHDNKRFGNDFGESREEYLKLALTFIMTYPAIPVIYYGTEIGMEGGDDPDNRRDMEWEKTKDSKVLKYYRDLVKIRNENPALKSKNYKTLMSDYSTICYLRGNEKNRVIVAINSGNEESTVELKIDGEGEKFVDVFNKKDVYKVENGKLSLKVKPLESVILIEK